MGPIEAVGSVDWGLTSVLDVYSLILSRLVDVLTGVVWTCLACGVLTLIVGLGALTGG